MPGVIRFDEQYNVVFKVETHNHPSALEPYGGANTGIGGVIRDPMGTGMGAKPVCNTDVFCFAPPDTPAEDLPPGVLHPRRVMKGVVAGVRDYGNRMGIPTINGAVYFDPRYLGNPLVYCGNIGIIPRDKSFKDPKPGDYIVAMGGRTGRDGIHGATFSSAELTSHSETLSGGAVQIGNAITEKMLLDVLLAARDQGLYNAVTDCGAGGFSSAVGEMGEKIGAEVWLERIPLKYEGLSYTEIWISEAQERMTLSVPPEKWEKLSALCAVGMRRSHDYRKIRAYRPIGVEIRRSPGGRPDHGFSAQGPAAGGSRRGVCAAASGSPLRAPTEGWPGEGWGEGGIQQHAALAQPVQPVTSRIPCTKSSARSTYAANIGSSGSTITRCKAGASSNLLSAWQTTAPATRLWFGRCLQAGAG